MARQPRLLDLFCGAGGAAMGYSRAGFDVTGVDIVPQKHYPFRFIQADALTFPLAGYDAIHASPLCGDYCALREFTKGRYPRLIDTVFERLCAAGAPFVIENSPRAPMPGAVILCGSAFGLPILRHRAFWSNVLIFAAGACRHTGRELIFSRSPERAYRDAMGVSWMPVRTARQAIPPAYTEWIGRQLRTALDGRAA